MKVFKGRVVVQGTAKAEALVSHNGFNTLASYQKSLMFDDKKGTCSDQNNLDLYNKWLRGKALCLPKTIGYTTGGMAFYCAAVQKKQPAMLLFSQGIDSLAAAGVTLIDVWTDCTMPTIDNLGEEFLAYVKDGMTITVTEDGSVMVE